MQPKSVDPQNASLQEAKKKAWQEAYNRFSTDGLEELDRSMDSEVSMQSALH